MSSRTHTVVSPAPEAVATSPTKEWLVQRTCACGGTAGISGACENCATHRLQRQPASNTKPPQAPSIVHDVLRLNSQPLDASTRAFFEPRFGHDFSRVRIHADAEAPRSATAVNALAYTAGEHIVFQTGRYAPSSTAGRRLLAHELTHVVQQTQQTHSPVQHKLEIGMPGDQHEIEADRIADRIADLVVSDTTTEKQATLQKAVVDVRSASSPSRLQRQAGPNTCPARVNFSTGNDAVHVPLCGIANVTATTVPASIPGISWSLAAGTAQVASGTRINANGEITFGAAQTGGTITVTATNVAAGNCTASADLILNSHPSGISSTFVVGALATARTHYGAVFDHHFTSADGLITSIEDIPVGEQFRSVPNPTTTSHVIPGNTGAFPFPSFTFTTAHLTPNATDNWFIVRGTLDGRQHDKISFQRSLVDVGQFVASASNPPPTNSVPASFTLTQSLFWFCRQAAPASRWTWFVDADHVRTLRLNGSNVEFVVSDNGEPNVENYTGNPAIIHAAATPATIPPTPPRPPRGPVPAQSTTRITADTLPSPMPRGHGRRFSIRGNALGCRVNSTTGVFTAGPTAGAVTVRVSDAARNPNFDEVVVTIANPAAQPAQPVQPPAQQPGQHGRQPGQQPAQQPRQQPAAPPGQQGRRRNEE